MQILPTIISLRNMPWQYMLISCVSNAKNHISEDSKIANVGQKKIKENLIQKSQFVRIAVKSQWKTVLSMETTTQNSNVSSAALSHSGSAGNINITLFPQNIIDILCLLLSLLGALHIFVNPAIRNSVMVIMYPNTLRINCQCAKEGINVQLEGIISQMEKKLLQDVLYVETLEITKKHSEENKTNQTFLDHMPYEMNLSRYYSILAEKETKANKKPSRKI